MSKATTSMEMGTSRDIGFQRSKDKDDRGNVDKDIVILAVDMGIVILAKDVGIVILAVDVGIVILASEHERGEGRDGGEVDVAM
uniref:Uncharacterized protein n=1 Tax=Chromera velia CCMP2878 TaxID=1169474 RepID=A0A0G4HM05_9ALVE|eukprot:Cvel_28958.t1-p1 / transcript=Cvel_28958.t1 / gene=Cvel_28958 / organism=Chromera_velia_CCMP2878 / gene_product=hypothetical protein / transcript_product=hypothetical protein / location=Cvel_scaffold3886:11185-11433(+) / protein_length=83 / sequence_SO=supercontig / SO=protein_coding / is_pseudo=false